MVKKKNLIGIKIIKYYMFYFYLGNVFGMIGVLLGVVVIFGLLKLFLENFIQMVVCMGVGNVNYIDFKFDFSFYGKRI